MLGLYCWESPATWGSPIWGLGLVLSLSPKAPAHACCWRLWFPGLTCMALEGTPLSIGHPVHPSHSLRVFGGGAGAFLTQVGTARCECKARAVGARRGNRSCALLPNTLSSREPS